MKEEVHILHGPEFGLQFPEGTTLAKLMYNQLESHGTNVAQVRIPIAYLHSEYLSATT